ncbi:unnamed protein product, partial [Medioppia subpectinata]
SISLSIRVTPLLGYLPQELMGTSCYDYCHPDDVLTLAESHRTALHQTDRTKNSLPYRFRTKLGTYLYLTTLWKIFKNPWTREFEYMVAVNENVATPDPPANHHHHNHRSHHHNRCPPAPQQSMPATVARHKTGGGGHHLDVSDNSARHHNHHKRHTHSSSQSSDEGLITSQSSPSTINSMSSSATTGTGGQSSSDIPRTSPLSANSSIVKRFIANRIKHSKIGQQIAEEVLEAQRRADEFSSSSSQSSSNSPPSSLDTGSSGGGGGVVRNNGSISSSSAIGSLTGSSQSVSSATAMTSVSAKQLSSVDGDDNGYDLTRGCDPSFKTMSGASGQSPSESGVCFDTLSLPSVQSMSNSSLTDISQLEPITDFGGTGGASNGRYLTLVDRHVGDCNNHDGNNNGGNVFSMDMTSNARMHYNRVATNNGHSDIDGLVDNRIQQQQPQQHNVANDEINDAAMNLIMSILESESGELGGQVDLTSMPWPMY